MSCFNSSKYSLISAPTYGKNASRNCFTPTWCPHVDARKRLALLRRRLLGLERVHGLPEAVIAVGQQGVRGEGRWEGGHDELPAGPRRLEDRGPQEEETAVDPQARLPDVLDARDLAAVAGHDEVIAEMRLDAEEARDPTVPLEMLKLCRQRQVGEPVAVVREELALPRDVGLHDLQALPDARVDAG